MRRCYKLLIFDWDGTLIDSESGIVSCMKAAIRDTGLATRNSQEIGNIIGLGLQEALFSLFPNATDLQHRELTEHYRNHFLAMEQSQPFDGVQPTLDELSNLGFVMAIATGKGRAGLNRALAGVGFEHLFHASRCADETQSKPHPQMLNELLDELDITADNALMIGDTEYDLAMARAAGIDSMAVSYGVHNIQRLFQYRPVSVLDKFEDILPWLTTEAYTPINHAY